MVTDRSVPVRVRQALNVESRLNDGFVSHDAAELLTMLSFVVFGALVLGANLDAFTWRTVLYAALSLTVVRGLAVAISLVGSRARAPTTAFLAWFGPRGIASVLYSFLLLESSDGLPVSGLVVDVVMVTVTMSVVLHGITAAPWAAAYGRWFTSMEDEHDEMVEAGPAHEHHLGRMADAVGEASSVPPDVP